MAHIDETLGRKKISAADLGQMSKVAMARMTDGGSYLPERVRTVSAVDSARGVVVRDDAERPQGLFGRLKSKIKEFTK